MPRPCKCRRVCALPASGRFGPEKAPDGGSEVVLPVDELEAVRLADLEGLYHEQAARRMGVSRQTFGNIVARAREKIADAIVNARPLVIAGGAVRLAAAGKRPCPGCRRGTGGGLCPRCRARGAEGNETQCEHPKGEGL